jgi:phosphate transport system substrate-binding protein
MLTLMKLIAAAAACPLLAAARAQSLDNLPRYVPEQQVSGTIRCFGSPLAGFVPIWEAGFRKFQPDVRFDDRFPSSDAWASGLEAGVADIGTSGREPMLTEYLGFTETFHCYPTEITVATGSYDVKGKTWALIIYVRQDNPLTQLTIEQLDGIFGAERTGGYAGIQWMPQLGRGPEKNIRMWGQLGLTGGWADRPIQTYGYAFTGMTNFFQRIVFQNGDKWNPDYRQYIEYGTPMVADGELGRSVDSKHMLETLARDRFGIAWCGVEHARDVPGLKVLALAARGGGPFVMPSRETVQNRTYPLTRSVFMYLKRTPGEALDPKVREFLRYVLSREGQEEVAKRNLYLPLTAAVVAEQRRKLD